MDFGKVSKLDGIDFNLPAPPVETKALLSQQARKAQPTVYIGCPIWSQKAWVGQIYPSGTRSQDYLYYYARQFNTIELNSTHYSLPAADRLQYWCEQTPTTFHFCPKVPQLISHHQLLNQQAERETQIFCQFLRALTPQLGMPFLQLPPYFTTEHLPCLANVYQALSNRIATSL